jgi:hypothetical protein
LKGSDDRRLLAMQAVAWKAWRQAAKLASGADREDVAVDWITARDPLRKLKGY